MSRSHLFVSSTDQPRARRAGDFILFAFGLIILALDGLFAAQKSNVGQAAADVFTALPGWTQEVFEVGYTLAALFSIWLLVMALIRRRWDITVSIVLSVAMAIAAGLVLARLTSGEWPAVFPEFQSASAGAVFPVMRVAVVTSVVFAVGPHVARSVRWLGWFFVALVIVSGIGIGLGLPSDAIGGLGLGIISAGAVLMMFGSPAGYPDTDEVATQLRTLDIDLGDLTPSSIQTWGARTLDGRAADGRAVVVKVYGSDARDAQIVARTWRYLWYKDTGPSLPWSRLQQVEHEALVTVLAADAGVNCPEVIVAATSEDGDAILVTERRGLMLADLEPDDITDDQVVRVWEEVRTLHAADMSHGALDMAHVGIDGDRGLLADFQAGSLSTTDARIAIDVAELIVSVAAVVGVERAVATAQAGVGDEALSAAVPYLQLPALSPTSRRGIDKAGKLVKQVRSAVVEATGVEAPEAVRLRRIGIRDIVVIALILLLTGWLLQQVTGVDWQEVWQTIQGADWPWVVAALIVAQLILVPNAVSLMSVVRAPLPLRPTILLQSAIQFIGVAVPSAAGRIATNIAYLRKFGLTPTVAVTQGALDSFSMFLVQVAILIVAFLFGDVDFGFTTSSGGSDWVWVLVAAIVVIVAGVVVVLAVEKVRNRVLLIIGEARRALSVLIEEPKRAVILFSSNFTTELVLGLTMWLAVNSIGAEISVGAALAVVVGAVLLGGLAPTPGGVGVQEAVLAAGLVGVGVSSTDATAAAVIYRIVTFALPPFWGAASLAWLRRNDYI